MKYEKFLSGKRQMGCDHGFDPVFMPDQAFPFQRDLIEWSVRKGRAALFADCGMGKTLMLSQLERIGYTGQPLIIPACAVDAKHRRDRVWIVAHRERKGLEGHAGDGPGIVRQVGEVSQSGRSVAKDGLRRGKRALPDTDNGGFKKQLQPDGEKIEPDIISSRRNDPDGLCTPVSDADSGLCDGRAKESGRGEERGVATGGYCRWDVEPGVGRVANGIPNRVDRLRGLGNAIVPQVAAEILRCMMAADALQA